MANPNQRKILLFRKSSGDGSDADAQAFTSAANIIDNTQKSAVSNLVSGLKTSGLWAKMKAIYPFVGGNANSHKFNLKDPRDLDAAYRLIFIDGWTHSATGALPNAGFADTKLNALAELDRLNLHISYYSRTQNNANAVDMGAAAPDTAIQINFGGRYYGASGAYAQAAGTLTTGLFIANRITDGEQKGYRNGVVETTVASAAYVALADRTIFISGYNTTAGGQYPTNRECAFASIGEGLTDSEAVNFYNLVQNFQTALGRQV